MAASPLLPHVALLRGINVGGRHKLPMKRLVALLDELGFPGARTYIQSGNVVFDATSARAKGFAARAADAIEREFGFPVPVTTRSAAELARVVRKNPFVAAGAGEGELHVVFLASRPAAGAAAALPADASSPDEFVVRGREVYLRCPNGVARSKLTNAFFERLGSTATARNWRTTVRLLELARS